MASDISPEDRERSPPEETQGPPSPESSGSPPSFHYPSSSSDDGARFVPEEPVSDGSVYEPSDKSSEGQPAEPDPDEIVPLEHHDDEDYEQDALIRSSPRKRLASDTVPPQPPLKRQRGVFNHAYLALLNSDIEDAAARYIAVPPPGLSSQQPELTPSQLGLSYWTAAEKEVFFEALARLGRDDTPGIARHVRTKGELEVRLYLGLLGDALDARRAAGELDPLVMSDYPAAVELSVECCHALDEAADAVALRQEAHEEGLEQQKWASRGADWLVTPRNCRVFDDGRAAKQGGGLRSAELFRVENWLSLSERLFMNANYDEGNWQSIASEPPSIRTTALEDFYSLALSLTRRLMSAAMYISMSRIRSKKAVMPWTRELVRKKDVEAAVLSLGLKTDAQEFWTGCARRLKLDVYDDEIPAHDEVQEPMPYTAVERALAGSKEDMQLSRPEEEDEADSPPSDLESVNSSLDLETLVKQETVNIYNEGEASHSDGETNDSGVHLEAQEVTEYSALGYPDTHRARKALISRIAAEREQEDYADTLDRHVSYGEEKRLWSLLGRQPAQSPAKVENLSRPISRTAVDDIHPVGRNWRQRLKYISEWEDVADMLE